MHVTLLPQRDMHQKHASNTLFQIEREREGQRSRERERERRPRIPTVETHRSLEKCPLIPTEMPTYSNCQATVAGWRAGGWTGQHTHTYIYILTCLHTHMSTCLHTHTYIHANIDTYKRSLCTYKYIHTRNLCTYKYIHTRKQIHTYKRKNIVKRYGVATISRLLKNVGLFCKRDL